LLCLNYADKIPIVHSDQSVGGNAANVAVGTKKLGLKTAIVTELGDDINGRAIESELKKSGVDTKLVKIIKKAETRYSVVLNYKSERTILSYHAKRNYSLPRLPKTDWIYYTSLGKNFEKMQKQLVAHLKKNPQIKLSMNPGSYQLKNGLPAIKQILPLLDLLIVNKEEAERIVGENADSKKLCLLLHVKGAKQVVITDGLNGSYAFDGEKVYHLHSAPLKAKAKTGAGDAYTSGFLSAIIYGLSVPEAMQWGTANAEGVIQVVGAQKGLLNKANIKKKIKKYSEPKIV
jgi:sugar/nucleoside kinase (ribokinase family)